MKMFLDMAPDLPKLAAIVIWAPDEGFKSSVMMHLQVGDRYLLTVLPLGGGVWRPHRQVHLME